MSLKKIYLIGVVGQGFEGKLNLAIKHIRFAAKSKIDAIKFSNGFWRRLATSDYKYYKLFKSLEINLKGW